MVCNLSLVDTLTRLFTRRTEEFMDGVTTAMVRQLMRNLHMLGFHHQLIGVFEEVRKLAAGGGNSAVLTDACSLKELCEFKLADSIILSNASKIEDVASRTGSEALARLCEGLREHLLHGGDFDCDEDDTRNRNDRKHN